MSRAFTDGAQVISMSLGSPNGWSEEAQNVVGQRIAARGVFLSVAVGDEGADGVFDISTPSSGLGATGVASVDNSAIVFWNAATGNGSKIVRSQSMVPCPNISHTSKRIRLGQLDQYPCILRPRHRRRFRLMLALLCPIVHPISASLWSSHLAEIVH